MKEIKDEDDDQAHIEESAPAVLKFKHANADHEDLMIGKVLEETKGICHSLFKEDGDGEDEDAPAAEDKEEGMEDDAPLSKDILSTSRHVFVEEVVEDKKVHFWKVPRLGSFMAIPLVY